MPRQISQVTAVMLRIEDRVGALADMLDLLQETGLNMVAIASERQVGTAIMVIPDDMAAVRKLASDHGITLTQHQVFAVEGSDGKGVLREITRAIADAGINIEDVAALSSADRYVAVFSFADADLEAAGEALGF